MRRLVLLVLLVAPSLDAQQQTQRPRNTDPAAFAIEAAAGSLGSLVGIAVVGLTHKCGVEDLGCLIIKAGASGATGALGATLATYAAAGYTGSKRSIIGAAVGAVIGTGVGLGVHWLLNNSTDRNFDDAYAVVPIFTLGQGIFSTIGSRIVAR